MIDTVVVFNISIHSGFCLFAGDEFMVYRMFTFPQFIHSRFLTRWLPQVLSVFGTAVMGCALAAPFAAHAIPQASAKATKVAVKKPALHPLHVAVHAKSRMQGKRVVAVARPRFVSRAVVVLAKPSFGQMAGLHGAQDALDLKSSVALVAPLGMQHSPCSQV